MWHLTVKSVKQEKLFYNGKINCGSLKPDVRLINELTSESPAYSVDSPVQQAAALLLNLFYFVLRYNSLRWDGFDLRAVATA